MLILRSLLGTGLSFPRHLLAIPIYLETLSYRPPLVFTRLAHPL
jgi:hypothetical protein